ncbi:DMT family transporter [Rhizobium paknamense]|uniref:Drug/metabolite transporter (DMT)-like permease n=1 Tax=Rhizobium paknamense TaxID=1206817 RepID=A0ABU0IHK1_9HYPH|nr:DMT family transporter [Rhizobium paknamense]MDQ0457103.1 drug/metabolite transporter (DMT)-like permease [Rhizobium paknamense]
MPARAYAYLILTTLLWGGNAVAGKLAVGHVSPMFLNLVRWMLAFLAVLAVSLPQIRADWPLLRRHWLLLLALGAIGFTAFNGFLYSAVQYTSVVNAVIEQGGVPVVIFLLNFLLFRVPVSALQIIGFSISFVGVAITAGHGDLKSLLSLTLNFGDLLMLLGVLCYSVYTVALRFKPPVHWKSLMAATALGAILAGIPLLVFEAAAGRMVTPDGFGLLLILYTGLLPALVSQILYIRGVDIIGPNRAGLFVNLVPVFGTILSVLLVGEDLHLFHVVALTLVLGGIAIAELGKGRRT